MNYTDIKSVEDALKATGRPAVPEFADAPEDMREYFQAQYKAVVIAEAINGDWKADFHNREQKKWLPYFYTASGGFVFNGTIWALTHADAGYASRLCFETEAKARHAGKFFTEIFGLILTK